MEHGDGFVLPVLHHIQFISWLRETLEQERIGHGGGDFPMLLDHLSKRWASYRFFGGFWRLAGGLQLSALRCLLLL